MLAPRYVLFRLMNGLAAFYKPPNMNTEKFISFMKRQLSEGLCRLDSRRRYLTAQISILFRVNLLARAFCCVPLKGTLER